MSATIKRLNLELYNGCNYHCKMCGDKRVRDYNHMSKTTITQVLRNLIFEYGNDTPEVRLFVSGEPTLASHFQYALFACKRHDLKTLIHTNGSMWNEQMINDVAMLSWSKLKISFSLDGGCAHQYKQMRGIDNFEKVKTNIQKFLTRLETVRSKPQVVVQCLVDEQFDYDLIMGIQARYTSWFPGAEIYVRPIHNWDTKEKFTKVKKSYGSICDFMYGDLIIYSDGKVGLCCADLNAKTTFGYIEDYGYSPKRAFKCKSRESMRQWMSEGKDFLPCRDCERYESDS